MIIFFLAYFFVCISDSYSAVLPLNETVADRQAKVVEALNHPPYNPDPNNHNFLEHVNFLHRPETIESLSPISISNVFFDRSGLPQGKSSFFTSDRRIIKNFIAEAINFAQQNPIPAHTTLTRYTRLGIPQDNHIEIICDLNAAGILSPYFIAEGGIGMDLRTNLRTNRIAIYLKINNYDGLWRFSTAYPIT